MASDEKSQAGREFHTSRFSLITRLDSSLLHCFFTDYLFPGRLRSALLVEDFVAALLYGREQFLERLDE